MKKSVDAPGWMRYLAGAGVLLALVWAALLLPQSLFEAQDKALCGGMTLVEGQEYQPPFIDSVYETSLSARLEKFAAGIAQGRNYYVSQQEIEVTQEIREQIKTAFYDDMGENHQIYLFCMNVVDYLPVAFWNLEDALPQVMKQYVVYSDDYREGVSFILWCLELCQTIQGEEYKLTLLLDAKTLSFYGYRTDRGAVASLKEYHQGGGLSAVEWWAVLGSYYQGILETNLNWFYEGEALLNAMYERLKKYEGPVYEWLDDNTLLFSYPFEETTLHVRIHTWETDGQSDGAYGTKERYPGICLELLELCRLIPEFSQDG